MSGGELKLLNFYKALSVHHDVMLLTATYPTRYEEIVHAPGFIEHRVPKPPGDGALWAALNDRGMDGELSGVLNAAYGRIYPAFRETFDQLLERADLVVHDSPFAATWDRWEQTPHKPRIYNSYNLELALGGAVMSGDARQGLELIETCERALVSHSRRIFASSPSDAAGFELLYDAPRDRIRLMPMGFAEEEFAWRGNDARSPRRTCLFIGSAHGPNKVAAMEFVEIARRSPQHDFVLAGALGVEITPKPENLTVTGRLSAAEKQNWFRRADTFINMMRTGSGVNVKVVEALAAGHVVLSTSHGLRGLNDPPDAVRVESMETAVAYLRNPAKPKFSRSDRQKWARRHHGWRSIAKMAAAEISAVASEALAPSRAPPETIDLYLNDYPLGAGESGGARRMLRLLEQAPSAHRKVLVTLTDAPALQISMRQGGLVEINVPKSQPHLRLQNAVNARSTVSVNDVLAIEGAPENALLLRILSTLACNASTIVFEHCYMAGLLPALRAKAPQARIVYSSHNQEAILKAELLSSVGHPDAEALAKLTAQTEGALLEAAAVVVCVSASDAEAMGARRPGEPAPVVVLNGADMIEPPVRQASDGPFRLVFLGSGHPPNVEGLTAFLRGPFADLQDVRLDVIGGAGAGIYDLLDGRIKIWGVIDDAQKAEILGQADLAINPSLSGGGSSLKIGDYLAAGLPVLTTPLGGRGFGQDLAELAITAPLEGFKAAIRNAQSDRPALRRRGAAGRAYVAQYLDWTKLARRYEEAVRGPAITPRTPPKRRRILVVTYRYTEPRRGGAEEYLYQVLKRWAFDHHCDIDLIAPDVREIRDQAGLAVGIFGKASEAPILAEFARWVDLPPVALEGERERRLTGEWLAELRIEQQAELINRMRPLASVTGIAGGWHGVEGSGEKAFRWSSRRAFLHVEPGMDEAELLLELPRGVQAIVSLNGWTLHTAAKPGRDKFRLSIPPEGAVIEVTSMARFESPGDSRYLGVRLRGFRVRRKRSWKAVSPRDEVLTVLRRDHQDALLDAYMDRAASRPVLEDVAFRVARTFDAATALDLLAQRAANCDHVLVQGIQFGFIASVCETLNDLGVRFTLLPHAHLDDDFYHWRMMYDCLARATQVISVEGDRQQAQRLSRFNANLLPAAGGGVDPEEYRLVDQDAWNLLRKARGVPETYFLVLGRKVASKGYGRIVEAFAQAGFDDVGLVLIGPDGDGAPIDVPGVFALGEQPRDMVLGALAGCTALASMSESESFGIVLAEAWMLKKPVIANRLCQAFASLVDDGFDGLLVETGQELTEAMEKLLGDQTLRDAMGQAGRSKAVSRLTWDHLASTLLAGLTPSR